MDEHLQFLGRNFQEALSSQSEMFLASVNDYVRCCNFGDRDGSDDKYDCPCGASENMYRLKQELSGTKEQLVNAQTLISQLESLISVLRGAVKVSQAVNENIIKE